MPGGRGNGWFLEFKVPSVGSFGRITGLDRSRRSSHLACVVRGMRQPLNEAHRNPGTWGAARATTGKRASGVAASACCTPLHSGRLSKRIDRRTAVERNTEGERPRTHEQVGKQPIIALVAP